jgi:hypothetical protein
MGRSLFEFVEGTMRLRVTGRHIKPVSDELLLTVEQRSTGAGRSILLDYAATAELAAVLNEWITQGWPGVRPGDGRQDAAHRREIADWEAGIAQRGNL